MPLTRIDHVQLAMPPGGDDRARGFYAGLLGLVEVAKPVDLEGRGGCWFEVPGLRLHLGVEAEFAPARKAHPALRATTFPDLVATLRNAGCAIREDGRFEGAARIFVDDPFGNRIEIVSDV